MLSTDNQFFFFFFGNKFVMDQFVVSGLEKGIIKYERPSATTLMF